MPWRVRLKESVIEDLRWFGRKDGRLLLKLAEKRLAANPLAETRNMKTLRPNPVAQRELRLFGKYRLLLTWTMRSRSSRLCWSAKSAASRCWCRGRSSQPMKVIPLSEAKAKLSRYAKACHDEPVIATVNGVPSFQLVPLEEDDDLIDRLLETTRSFAGSSSAGWPSEPFLSAKRCAGFSPRVQSSAAPPRRNWSVGCARFSP
jgi:prevent-host-death family protein